MRLTGPGTTTSVCVSIFGGNTDVPLLSANACIIEVFMKLRDFCRTPRNPIVGREPLSVHRFGRSWFVLLHVYVDRPYDQGPKPANRMPCLPLFGSLILNLSCVCVRRSCALPRPPFPGDQGGRPGEAGGDQAHDAPPRCGAHTEGGGREGGGGGTTGDRGLTARGEAGRGGGAGGVREVV